VLAGSGFECAAFVNAFFLGDRFGYARGFEPYRYIAESHRRGGETRKIVRNALDWVRGRLGRRFFLFVHLFDVHSDYRSKPAYEQMFTTAKKSPFDGNTVGIWMAIRGDFAVKPADLTHLEGLYDAGIRQLDDQLQPLLELVKRSDVLANTVVVVTSDHGEEFQDHGSFMHGSTHYQELLHVPLILAGASVPKGLRITAPVSLVDVMPTALDLLGVPAQEGVDGRSLRPLWEGDAEQDGRLLLAETGPMEDDALRSVRRGHLKLIADSRTGEKRLYDLADDPGETRDLAAQRPDDVRELSDRLEALSKPRRQPTLLPEPTPEMQEHLRALGYIEID
jgi:arylsulfatase A-like enzyme